MTHSVKRDYASQDDNSGFENSEDCLTINVVRPYGIYKGGQHAPVVAWSMYNHLLSTHVRIHRLTLRYDFSSRRWIGAQMCYYIVFES